MFYFTRWLEWKLITIFGVIEIELKKVDGELLCYTYWRLGDKLIIKKIERLTFNIG